MNGNNFLQGLETLDEYYDHKEGIRFQVEDGAFIALKPDRPVPKGDFDKLKRLGWYWLKSGDWVAYL